LAKTKTFFSIATFALKEKGVAFFLNRFFDYLISFWAWQYYKMFTPEKIFTLQGNDYKYFYNLYNITWKNERTVEIPFVWDAVQSNQNKNILEVGNVLSWYFPIQHEVVDKYEVAEGVINEDIVDFNPLKKYDLIVSISTMEHVGWDETPREPQKILRAIEQLKRLLAAGGKLIITVPLGYNTALDEYLRDGSIRFTEQYFLKKGLKNPEWNEVNEKIALEEVKRNPYKQSEFIMLAIEEK
jgi:SAM-dependent methyltransferase